KKGGKALYVYARKGEDVEREPRTVHIGAVDVLALDGATATCRIECSGGTYVRTLAHDLGAAVGCGAHLAGLRRTRVGRFRLEDALPLDGVEVKDLIPLRDALPPVPLIPLTSGQTDDIRHGRAVTVEHLLSSAVAALLGPHGEVVGMARVHGNVLQPECVIPGEAMHGQL
ncbi:MAG TPA: hypothetical protein VEX38_07600, partial [Fimbriimonadaceae bacterium]|nr:hypothetical protein [Fimbriimonadaceae bacterium]